MCSWSCCSTAVPPTQKSAQESDKLVHLLSIEGGHVDLIVGAGSKMNGGGVLVETISGAAETTHVPGVVWVGGVGEDGCCGCVGCGRGP